MIAFCANISLPPSLPPSILLLQEAINAQLACDKVQLPAELDDDDDDDDDDAQQKTRKEASRKEKWNKARGFVWVRELVIA